MSLQAVLADLRAAEVAAQRPAGSVRLIAVSKGHSVEQIEENIVRPGLMPAPLPLAENRGQELRDKQREVAELNGRWPEVEWHFIGPIQRNKIKYLRGVSLIHTVEEDWQPAAIARAAEGWGHAPAVLLQLSNGEAQKHGVAAADLPKLHREAQDAGLEVRGIMVMAPYGDPAAARQVFEDAARHAADLGLNELSMGMSDDFTSAIAAGATLIRIGRRLFT